MRLDVEPSSVCIWNQWNKSTSRRLKTYPIMPLLSSVKQVRAPCPGEDFKKMPHYYDTAIFLCSSPLLSSPPLHYLPSPWITMLSTVRTLDPRRGQSECIETKDGEDVQACCMSQWCSSLKLFIFICMKLKMNLCCTSTVLNVFTWNRIWCHIIYAFERLYQFKLNNTGTGC